MSGKGRIIRLLGGLLLREAEILSVDAVGPRFRHLRLAAPALRGVAWEPGDKIQVLLPGDDMRTYTPLHWSPDGTAALLVYLQPGSTPAARWGQSLQPGQPLRFVGPQRSLRLPPGPATLIGDETSLAVAASYRAARPDGVQAIFEVEADLAIDVALSACHLSDAVVVRRSPGQVPGEALCRALPVVTGSVGVTGSGALIQKVRGQLRAQGTRDIKVKAYWVAGRVGLD